MPKQYLMFRIGKDFKVYIEKKAKEESRTASSMVRKILKKWIENNK